MIFIDTSAFLALLDKTDIFHEKAVNTWLSLLSENEDLITNSYVLVESFAVIQNRLGLGAVEQLDDNILPHVEIDWLDQEKHSISLKKVLTANRRQLSLVDNSAFNTMQNFGINQVFTFDNHFAEEGFDVLP